jgi:hypothetical protein
MVNNCLKFMAGDGMDQFGSRIGAYLAFKAAFGDVGDRRRGDLLRWSTTVWREQA